MTLHHHRRLTEPSTGSAGYLLTKIIVWLRRWPDADYPWPEEPVDLADQDPDLLYAWLLEAERASKAARILRTRIESVLLEDTTRHGPIKLGESLYRPKRDTTKAWAFDGAAAAILGWLRVPGDAAHIVLEAFRLDPSNLRVTYLDGVAAKAEVENGPSEADIAEGLDEKERVDRAERRVRDTFLRYRDADPDGGARYILGKLPMKRAPQWAKDADHGTRGPKPTKRGTQ